jgi:hypothetical protein
VAKILKFCFVFRCDPSGIARVTWVDALFEEKSVKRVSSSRAGSGTGSADTALDRSLRFVVEIASFDGVSSLEA